MWRLQKLKMVEVIGDIVRPSDLVLPIETTTTADAMSGSTLQSGSMIYNTTLGKAEVFNGTAWETITSVIR